MNVVSDPSELGIYGRTFPPLSGQVPVEGCPADPQGTGNLGDGFAAVDCEQFCPRSKRPVVGVFPLPGAVVPPWPGSAFPTELFRPGPRSLIRAGPCGSAAVGARARVTDFERAATAITIEKQVRRPLTHGLILHCPEGIRAGKRLLVGNIRCNKPLFGVGHMGNKVCSAIRAATQKLLNRHCWGRDAGLIGRAN